MYGVNSKSYIKTKVINTILKNKKIDQIDTAISYKIANKKLSQIDTKKFKVCSKIPFYDLGSYRIEKKIFYDVKKHLNFIKKKKLEVLYLHDPSMLFNKNRNILIKILKKLKSNKIIKKIGFSVYSPDELNSLLKIYRPDVVQIPVNIFDRRFLKKSLLNKLKKKNISIYLRSIFLQGILLKNIKELPKFFYRWKNLFYNWEKWLKKNKISKVEGCLSILNTVNAKINLIIGVENPKQLEEILRLIDTKINPPKNIFSNNEILVNPSQWKLKSRNFK